MGIKVEETTNYLVPKSIKKLDSFKNYQGVVGCL